ncbi:cytochrome P450 [Aspergillus homomorphus CBS 101889]|uniref:Cytochrome P450 monooxygenase n=1 Tax=Aspergillus homomorphus (strain CBS 101889) TaxID=1450537 RepID=A0A395HVK4_ASPHC|nr:cytochrome P450 monooxygenase [Aspergillus homomorphus CBS 101889]RAL11559.1 cytochrome P450 monooxygenase [Aspergillus homomorphus CBS 101889]
MLTPTLILALLPLVFLYLWRRLRYLRFEQYASWPQLPPSLVWGHMKALNDFVNRGERRRHVDHVFEDVKAYLGNPPLYFLDLRPVVGVLGIVCNHEIAEQIARSTKTFPYSMGKSPTMKALEPLLGPNSLITAEGDKWKALRKRYNPGFAPQHLLTLLPCIIDKARIFVQCLDEYARTGEEFSLEDRCTSLTLDIIGAVTMDTDMHAQRLPHQQSPLTRLYRQLLASYSRDSNISKFRLSWLLVPFTYLRRKHLVRQIDAILITHIKAKYAEQQQQHRQQQTQTTTWDRNPTSRSVLALSLQETDTDHLTPEFLHETADQLKSFLFAGHDTTSILLQWTFYELSRTPRVLQAVRRELDTIFGKDTSSSPDAVAEMLLNSGGEDKYLSQMTFTAAVIKEILRLHPPSGSARYAPPGTGFIVTLPDDGRTICLDGVVMYNCATVVQRDEAVYGPTREEFWPERWLEGGFGSCGGAVESGGRGGGSASPKDGEKLKFGGGAEQIPASAWRPFERGPRNCIGQGLVYLEVRVILACTLRYFDFEKVGLGAVARDSAGEPVLDAERGRFEVVEELFNTMQVTAKPVDGMRMKVRFASGE